MPPSAFSPPRAFMPDYLRLIALFGIVVVNVSAMAFPVLEGFPGPEETSRADQIAAWLVEGLAYMKTYGLFSFMFGVGLAFQMRSAERRGASFGPRYRNRMLGLLALGLLHGALLFPYDILVLYAATGGVLYTVRRWTPRALTRLGALLLVLQIPIAAALVLGAPYDEAAAALERAVMTGGGFGAVTAFRSETFLMIWPFAVLFQGFSSLGWFCLGLAAVTSGLIDTPDHSLWAKARRYCLVPGVGCSLLGAGLWRFGPESVGAVLTIAAAPVATLGYLGLIAAIARPPSRRFTPFLAAGGASLSVYLGQSIILATLFAPYGLGLWGAVGPLGAVGIAVAVTLLLILGLAAWRTRFALGPFEWVLRRITAIGERPESRTP